MTPKECLESMARTFKLYDDAWVNDMKDTGLPFDQPDDAPRFDGDTYDPAQDHQRLGKQAIKVFKWMALGGWWTLPELSKFCAAPEASISARLRDFRKPKFGSHTIERRRLGLNGLHQYRLLVNPQARLELLGIENK